MAPFTKFEVLNGGYSRFAVYVDYMSVVGWGNPLGNDWRTDARRFIESAISEKIEREKEKG